MKGVHFLFQINALCLHLSLSLTHSLIIPLPHHSHSSHTPLTTSPHHTQHTHTHNTHTHTHTHTPHHLITPTHHTHHTHHSPSRDWHLPLCLGSHRVQISCEQIGQLISHCCTLPCRHYIITCIHSEWSITLMTSCM